MNKRVLLIATVQSHIGQFHKPLMQLLKENGWEIHVAARNNLGEKDGLALEYPDKVFDIPFQRSPFDRKNLTAYRMLKQLLEREHYDVIHCNTPVGGILGRVAGRKYRKDGTQVFYTVHGFHFYEGAPIGNWVIYFPVERWMARYTDKLITVNREDYSFAKKYFSCPVYHIHGVGADSSRYRIAGDEERDSLRKELHLKPPVILSVGELLPNKNHKTAVLAVKKVLSRFPDAQLLIAGNGPDRANLEALVKKEGMEEHVTFLGYTTRLPEYMKACDLLIACSYREGMPQNVIQAMLCGLPVAASDNRGHREVVREGVNGFLMNSGDAEGFSEGIVRILASNMDRKIIRGSARRYSDVCVKEELRKIYRFEDHED